MSLVIGSVSLTNKQEGLFLGSIKLDNLNVESNSVLYSSDGVNISGDNQKLKFDETLNQLTINDGLSYTSAYPISLQTSDNEATYYTGVLTQNKNNSDGASTHILITNDIGTDSSNYGGLDMASSNSTVQYGQFGTMKNALGLSSQSSSIVLTPNAGGQEPLTENANIMLTYNGGTKAHIINNNGQLIVGADTPDFTGSTYGGDDGGTNKVLTSNGTSGLKWVTPASGGVTVANQSNGNIPFCTNTVDSLNSDNRFTYDPTTNTLNVTNPFHININGVQPESNYALCSDGEAGGMKYIRILDIIYILNFPNSNHKKQSCLHYILK